MTAQELQTAVTTTADQWEAVTRALPQPAASDSLPTIPDTEVLHSSLSAEKLGLEFSQDRTAAVPSETAAAGSMSVENRKAIVTKIPLSDDRLKGPDEYRTIPGCSVDGVRDHLGGRARSSFDTRKDVNEAKPFDEQSQRTAVGHVRVACVNCHRRHLACDLNRPCQRCVSQGIPCTENIHRKRGRPRKLSANKSQTGSASAQKNGIPQLAASIGANAASSTPYASYQQQPPQNKVAGGPYDQPPSANNHIHGPAAAPPMHPTAYSTSHIPVPQVSSFQQGPSGYITSPTQSYVRSSAPNNFQVDDNNLWLNVTPQGVICNFSNGWQHYFGSQYFHKLYHRPFFELLSSDGPTSKQVLSVIERATSQVSSIVAQSPPPTHPAFVSTQQSSRFELTLCLVLAPAVLHVRVEFTGVATFSPGNLWQVVVFINCLLTRPPEYLTYSNGWSSAAGQPPGASSAHATQLSTSSMHSGLSQISKSAAQQSSAPLSRHVPGSEGSTTGNIVPTGGETHVHAPAYSSAPMSTLAAVASSVLATATRPSRQTPFSSEDAKYGSTLTPMQSKISNNS